MIVAGGGLAAASTAWLLRRHGHQVLLVAPAEDTGQGSGHSLRSGSRAALGLLMGQVFHRSRGRGWRLRQRSLTLWSEWRTMLAGRGAPIPWRAGLLLLAADAEEQERQRQLVLRRRAEGLPLEIWNRDRLDDLHPSPPAAALSALHSPLDGRIDPGRALDALLGEGERLGVERRNDRVEALSGGNGGWRAALSGGETLEAEWVVLAAGGGSADLLEELGASRPLEPVLGQALEVELEAVEADAPPGATGWPGAICWRGINLVPRPDLPGGRRFWIGATLEPGRRADPLAFSRLRDLEGTAPDWLQRARLLDRWQGLRQRPVGRPAPLLERLAPGLILNGGHYRNGILLAPACAEWVLERIEARENVPLT